MKRSSAELKALARTQLSGKYGIYIGAALVYNLISGAVSGITAMIFPTFSVSNMILEQSISAPASLHCEKSFKLFSAGYAPIYYHIFPSQKG